MNAYTATISSIKEHIRALEPPIPNQAMGSGDADSDAYEASWQQVVKWYDDPRRLVTQGMEKPNPTQRFEGGQDNQEKSRDLSASIHADEILAKSQEVEYGQ